MREWPTGDVVGHADCEDREHRQERKEDYRRVGLPCSASMLKILVVGGFHTDRTFPICLRLNLSRAVRAEAIRSACQPPTKSVGPGVRVSCRVPVNEPWPLATAVFSVRRCPCSEKGSASPRRA